jgi:LysM repeat protein
LNRRSLILFVALNIFITFLVTALLIAVNDARRAAQPTPNMGGLRQVVITATTDPNITPEVVYVVVTATPPGVTGGGVVIQPTPQGGGTVFRQTQAAGGTGASTPLPGATDGPAQATTDSGGCPTHAIQRGETLGAIAPLYGITVDEIREANGLTPSDDARLQIGQVLIIPASGCGLPTRAPTNTPTRAPTSTPPATSTTAPTAISAASGARLSIFQVTAIGDITEERLELQNTSANPIEVTGWTLRDNFGNVYTFPEYTLFSGQRVRIYTRAGEDSALALFWGLSEAIWNSPNQRVIVSDASGDVALDVLLSNLPTAGVVSPGGPVPTPTPS